MPEMVASAALAGAAAVSGVIALVAIAVVLTAVGRRPADRGQIVELLGIALVGACLRFMLYSLAVRVSHLASYAFEVSVRGDLIDHLARVAPR
jgi:ABC-type transport system involved in cytochrome bd biosynthesis fused ATPase/permease subunit